MSILVFYAPIMKRKIDCQHHYLKGENNEIRELNIQDNPRDSQIDNLTLNLIISRGKT